MKKLTLLCVLILILTKVDSNVIASSNLSIPIDERVGILYKKITNKVGQEQIILQDMKGTKNIDYINTGNVLNKSYYKGNLNDCIVQNLKVAQKTDSTSFKVTPSLWKFKISTQYKLVNRKIHPFILKLNKFLKNSMHTGFGGGVRSGRNSKNIWNVTQFVQKADGTMNANTCVVLSCQKVGCNVIIKYVNVKGSGIVDWGVCTGNVGEAYYIKLMTISGENNEKLFASGVILISLLCTSLILKKKKR